MYLEELVRLVNRAQDSLDEADKSRGRAKTRHLLNAVQASQRATNELIISEEFWSDLEVTLQGADSEGARRIINDAAVFEMFLNLERRLLESAQLSTVYVDKIIVAMRDVRKSREGQELAVEDLRNQLQEARDLLLGVRDELILARLDLEDDERHHHWRRVVGAGIEALGGAAAVGVNATGVVATIGIATPAGAVSIGLGATIFGDGLSRMRG